MGYADSFEVPVTIQLNGDKLVIHQLTQRDYLPWLDELTTKMRERDTAHVNANVKQQDKKIELLRRIAMAEVIPDELEAEMATARGTIKVIQLAITKTLVKSGKTPEEALAAADAFIDSNSVGDNRAFAYRVSGLLTQARIQRALGILPVEPQQPNPQQPGEPGE